MPNANGSPLSVRQARIQFEIMRAEWPWYPPDHLRSQLADELGVSADLLTGLFARQDRLHRQAMQGDPRRHRASGGDLPILIIRETAPRPAPPPLPPIDLQTQLDTFTVEFLTRRIEEEYNLRAQRKAALVQAYDEERAMGLVAQLAIANVAHEFDVSEDEVRYALVERANDRRDNTPCSPHLYPSLGTPPGAYATRCRRLAKLTL